MQYRPFVHRWGGELKDIAKDIKIPRYSNKTCIACNFLDTVIILHTTAHKKFLDFLVQQPGNSAHHDQASSYKKLCKGRATDCIKLRGSKEKLCFYHLLEYCVKF